MQHLPVCQFLTLTFLYKLTNKCFVWYYYAFSVSLLNCQIPFVTELCEFFPCYCFICAITFSLILNRIFGPNSTFRVNYQRKFSQDCLSVSFFFGKSAV